MNRRLLVVTAAALGVAGFVLATALPAQGWRKRMTPGTYRAVLADFVVPRGQRVMDVYWEDPKMTEAFNRLEAEGYRPVFVVQVAEYRFLIVGRAAE